VVLSIVTYALPSVPLILIPGPSLSLTSLLTTVRLGCAVEESVTFIRDSAGVVVADNAVNDCHAGTTTAVGEREQIVGTYQVVADDAVGDRHGSPRQNFLRHRCRAR